MTDRLPGGRTAKEAADEARRRGQEEAQRIADGLRRGRKSNPNKPGNPNNPNKPNGK